MVWLKLGELFVPLSSLIPKANRIACGIKALLNLKLTDLSPLY